jgi:predicted nucleic acid-binding protein/predicted HTH domain antitoxin
MPTTIEIDGYLEQKLDVLVSTGLYATKTEAVRDAIRRLVQQLDIVSILMAMYRKGRVSLGYCAEASDLSFDDTLLVLQKKGYRPRLGVDELGVVETEMRRLDSADTVVVEGFTLGVLWEAVGQRFFSKTPWSIQLTQHQLEYLNLEARRSVMAKLNNGVSFASTLRSTDEFAYQNGVSKGEAASILLASKHTYPLIADDEKVRLTAERFKVNVAGSISVILYLLGKGNINEQDAMAAYEKLLGLGYYLPLSPAELSSKKLSERMLGVASAG